MEDPNLSTTPAADGSLVPDANSQGAAGTTQNEVAPTGGGGDAGSGGDAEFGFQRAEFGTEELPGTVQFYARHVFLSYKTPEEWPSHIEGAEFDRLPRLLAAAVAARKGEMKKKTLLTICGGEDSNESSNGDLLIFPDMVRYRRLTHFDVDNFVEEALLKEAEWLPGAAEPLTGSYVFVCSHGSRDRRCGVCGPALIEKFEEEINSRGLQGQVSVSPCSHIGGHKYAGNVIIYTRKTDGEVTGHWYGYVSPDDVPALLDQHIGKGEILTHLWRGQMGLPREEQKKAYQLLQQKVESGNLGTGADGMTNGSITKAGGCCQGVGNFTCCQSSAPEATLQSNGTAEHEPQKITEKSCSNETAGSGCKSACARKLQAIPRWFEKWEREDTYATLAVVAAAASIAIAYGCYKHLK